MKNVEIKARCTDPKKIEKILLDNGADFKGTDMQTDTYFNVSNGRLKLRQGNIENSLIFYSRVNQKGPKQSSFRLFRTQNLDEILPLLKDSLGILATVKKTRKIFFIDFVKFHIDHLEGFGDFVEIEVGDLEDKCTIAELEKVCDHYIQLFEILENDLVNESYSDMIIKTIPK
jgi:predicted adenylyl cyclase CyaB